MALNIKNEETQRLVKKLAELTGESQTSAVTNAVRERLNRIHNKQGESLTERMLAIGRDCASRLKAPFDTIDHAELLYDENGLPK
jgi:antitoxin VapB